MQLCENLYKFEKPLMEKHDNVSRVMKQLIIVLFEREEPKAKKEAKKENAITREQYEAIRNELRDELKKEILKDLESGTISKKDLRGKSSHRSKQRNASTLPFVIQDKKCSCEFPTLHAHKPRVVSAWRRQN